MYDKIKMALGPTQSRTAPLKSTTGEVITDQGQVYSRENLMAPSALDNLYCLPVLRNWMLYQQRTRSARPLTAWYMEKLLVVIASPLTFSRAARQPCYTPYINSSASAGKKALYHRTYEALNLSPCTRKAREVTATITERSPYLALWAKFRLWLS